MLLMAATNCGGVTKRPKCLLRRTIWIADAHRDDGNRFIDGNNDDGGGGNTLDARDTNSMTVLRSPHSRVVGSNTPRRDNTRIRNGDSRSCRPVEAKFPEFQ